MLAKKVVAPLLVEIEASSLPRLSSKNLRFSEPWTDIFLNKYASNLKHMLMTSSSTIIFGFYANNFDSDAI